MLVDEFFFAKFIKSVCAELQATKFEHWSRAPRKPYRSVHFFSSGEKRKVEFFFFPDKYVYRSLFGSINRHLERRRHACANKHSRTKITVSKRFAKINTPLNFKQSAIRVFAKILLLRIYCRGRCRLSTLISSTVQPLFKICRLPDGIE